MNMPNLPTDNLYKFKALSGVVIILVSIYLMVNNLLSLYEKVEVIALEQKILELEIESDSIEQVILDKEWDNFIKRNKHYSNIDTSKNTESLIDLYAKSSNKEEARKHFDFIFKHYDKFFPETAESNLISQKLNERYNINNQIKVKLFKLKSKTHSYFLLSIILLFVFLFLIVLACFGLTLAKNGFRDWYNLVQKYQDEKLKIEVEQLKKEVEQNNAK